MHLSEEAKVLLDRRDWDSLKALSLAALIDAESLGAFQMDRRVVSAGESVPAAMRCAVTLEAMNEPVVVSSGRIYSRAFVAGLLAGAEPTDPETRESLAPGVMCDLPQLSAAIAAWQRGEYRGVDQVRLAFKVTSSRIVMDFKTTSSAIKDLLASKLPRTRVIMPEGVIGYGGRRWGRTWSFDDAQSCGDLRFWFNKGDIANRDVVALLSMLPLPNSEEAAAEMASFDVTALPERHYVTFVEELAVSAPAAIEIINAFLYFSNRLQSDHGVRADDVDMVQYFEDAALPPRRDLGVGMFAAGAGGGHGGGGGTSSSSRRAGGAR